MSYMKKIYINKDFLYYTIVGLIFLLAIFVRTKAYITNQPLWHDECSLAMNIIHRNILGYFHGLEHSQVTPIGFVMLTKLISLVFGTKELTLRGIPYICGILSIPTFYYFSKMFLHKKWSIILVNVLFAINLQLIYYSQEFKQYSSDIFIFMLLFIIAVNAIIYDYSYKKVFLFSMFLAGISLCSFPSLFIIGAYTLYNLYIKFSEDKNIKKWILYFLPFATIILIYYLSVFITLQDEGMKTLYSDFYSAKGFVSCNIMSVIKLIKINLPYYFMPNKFILMHIILILTGLVWIIKQIKLKQNIILIICLFFILFASFLHIYPIMQRVSLYIVAILLILMVKPLDYISKDKKIYSIIIGLITLLSFYSYNLSFAKSILKSDFTNRYEPKETMKKLAEQYNPNDYIIINNASDSEWYYYSDYFNLKTKKYFVLIVPTPNKTEYIKALNMLPKENSYWFYFVNDYSHSPVIPFLKEWKTDKNIIYEYENKNSYLLYLKNVPVN